MLDGLREPIRRLLKVPPAPDPPRGDPRSVEIFRAAPGYYRYRLWRWGLKQASAAVGILVGLVFFGFVPDLVGFLDSVPEDLRQVLPSAPRVLFWFGSIEVLAIVLFLFQLFFSWLLLSLDYRYRWYLTTDRSLRIREGIWRVQERTMTFSNVQNVAIRQGPIQRLFGIADLEVRSAGGGGKESGGEGEGEGDDLHVGYFRGVAHADRIKDAILRHLRRLRATGLGDPEEPTAPTVPAAPASPAAAPAAGGDELLAAAREVLHQARDLRRAVRPQARA